MKGKADTQTRMDPGASILVDGGGPALSLRVAGGRNRISGKELTGGAERIFAGPAYKPEVRELEARGHFKVSH